MQVMAEPLNPHPNADGYNRGDTAEHKLFRADMGHAIQKGEVHRYVRPDGVVIPTPVEARPYFVEVKGQAHFRSPPFNGHGLPVEQVEKYTELLVATSMHTKLVIYEGPYRYVAWLAELERGEQFDTAGTNKTPRRIYPLRNFTRERRR